MSEVKETIIRNLEYVRHLRGIKKIDIAKHLGVSQGCVTNWLKGTNFIDVDNLYNLCMYLGITLDQVAGIAPIFAETLKPSESALIVAYRKADEGRRESVRHLLEIKEEKNESQSAI